MLAGPTFSPTGDRIAFFQPTDTGVHVFTMRTDGKELAQITAREGEVNVMPKWSADGAFLYFFQAKPAVSLRKVPVTGGDATEIGPWPWESYAVVDPQGRRVAYRRQTNDKTHVTVVHDRATRQETPLASPILPAAWSHDGQTIFGTEYPEPTGQISFGQDHRLRQPRPVSSPGRGLRGRAVQRRFPGVLPPHRPARPQRPRAVVG